ncbi:MAG: extracellular solute-binding protein [Rhizobiales bacterium]|nr:extracellular solute-binding protein [Hyphomicrobiales bacterium]
MCGSWARLRSIGLVCCALFLVHPAASAIAGTIEIFHADSLAGPMRELKKAFEANNKDVTINLTGGTSKELAERIQKGDVCDVFASSSPAVVDQDLMGKKIASTGQDAASWYVVFSANEMVVIAAKGNPLGIKQVSDLAKPDVKFLRVTAEKDLATNRTVSFLKRATELEGKPELAQKIIDASVGDASKPSSIPETVKAVREGTANAGVIYYSSAVAARNDVAIIRFPASVNMSEAIRNAATVPGTAKSPKQASEFVKFLLTKPAQDILAETGQPPIVPAIEKGAVPADIKN